MADRSTNRPTGRVWVPAEYDIGYVDGWVVLRRGADFKQAYVDTLPWKIFARVIGDGDDARKLVAALRAAQEPA